MKDGQVLRELTEDETTFVSAGAIRTEFQAPGNNNPTQGRGNGLNEVALNPANKQPPGQQP
jgi:hypothetical protein